MAHVSRTWLVQFDMGEARQTVLDFVDREVDVVRPAVARHLDEVGVGDEVVLWAAGRGAKAGVYGFGRVSGEVYPDLHPVSYVRQEGPRTLRNVSSRVRHDRSSSSVRGPLCSAG